MHLNGLGFGGLGVDDTTVLRPGQMVTFEITGGPLCAGVKTQDIANALSNWTSQMMTVDTVQSTMSGNIVPGRVDMNVNGTVQQTMPAGDLRGQILQALAAASSLCTNLSLVGNVLNIAVGGSAPTLPPDPNAIPWGIVIPASLLLVGLVLLRK